MCKTVILLATVCLFGLASCGTGIGMAWDRAWYGTPKEVVGAVQFMDETMNRELKGKYTAIEEAPVINPDGSVNHRAAENRFRDMAVTHAEIERWEQLSQQLAKYLGVSLEDTAGADEHRADKARRKFWSQLEKGAREALREVDHE